MLLVEQGKIIIISDKTMATDNFAMEQPPELNLKSRLDKAIGEVGGKDEAYKQELTSQVRDYMGYDNFVKKAQQLSKPGYKSDDSYYFSSSMSPRGVLNAVGAESSNRLAEIEDNLRMASRATSEGRQFANQLTAEEKKKLGQRKMEDLLDFKTEDTLDHFIKQYLTSPFNQNGSLKTVEEFQKQMEERIEGPGVQGFGFTFTPEQIKERINKRIPKEDQENLDALIYQAAGLTTAQAADATRTDRAIRGDIDEAEMEWYKLTEPTWYENTQIMMAEPQLNEDLKLVKTEGGIWDTASGKQPVDLSMDYPKIEKTKFFQLVKPQYDALFRKDIESFISKNSESLGLIDPQAAYEQGVSPIKYDDLVDPGGKYSEELTNLVRWYQGMFSRAELEQYIYDEFMRRKAELGYRN